MVFGDGALERRLGLEEVEWVGSQWWCEWLHRRGRETWVALSCPVMLSTMFLWSQKPSPDRRWADAGTMFLVYLAFITMSQMISIIYKLHGLRHFVVATENGPRHGLSWDVLSRLLQLLDWDFYCQFPWFWVLQIQTELYNRFLWGLHLIDSIS